jgi:hypothetical protein
MSNFFTLIRKMFSYNANLKKKLRLREHFGDSRLLFLCEFHEQTGLS